MAVEITGMGIITPAGRGTAGLRLRVQLPQSPSTPTFDVRIQDDLLLNALPNPKLRRLLTRGACLGVIAAMDAIDDAKLQADGCDSDRLGVFASGFFGADDCSSIYKVIQECHQQRLSWREDFGGIAIRRLPSLMLLRRLPNAAFCQIAQLVNARGYNATVMAGPLAAMHILRQAVSAIEFNRLDAAIVVCFDSLVSWEKLGMYSHLGTQSAPLPLGEAGVAFLLERSTLRRRNGHKSHVFPWGAASRHAKVGVISRTTSLPPVAALTAPLSDALSFALSPLGTQNVAWLNVSGSPLGPLDVAERSTATSLPNAEICATGPVILGAACGACGIADVIDRLSRSDPDAVGVIVRVSATGACGAIVIGRREPRSCNDETVH